MKVEQHFNIQINIQQVDVEPVSGKPRGVSEALSGKERTIIPLLEMKVTAPTLQEAYSKVARLVQMEQEALLLPREGKVGDS